MDIPSHLRGQACVSQAGEQGLGDRGRAKTWPREWSQSTWPLCAEQKQRAQ